MLKPGPIDQFPIYKSDGYVKVDVNENVYYWLPKFKFKQYVDAAEQKSDWYYTYDDSGWTIYSADIERTDIEEAVLKTYYNTWLSGLPTASANNLLKIHHRTVCFKLDQSNDPDLMCASVNCTLRCRATGVRISQISQ